MKTWLKFLLTGVAIGLMFPGAALVWIVYVLNETQASVSISQAHNAHPLLFIVDLAPLVLGITFLILGLKAGRQRTARLLIEEEYRGALSVANIPIVMIRIDGIVEGCNAAVEKVVGLSQIEIIGKNILTDFVRADAQNEIRDKFADLLQTRELYNLEIPLIDATGNLKLVLISARVRLDTTKEVDGFMIFGQDITRLRNQEAEINREQQLARIGQLTGGVVHDLNNMLNIVAGNIKFLKEEPAYEGTDSEELLEDIESAASDAIELINRLLSFSRERPAAPSEMPAKTMMEEAEKLARRLIKEQDILLTFDPLDDDVRVNIDFVWFKNCLLNLINNAADSMESGAITVTTTVETSSSDKVAGSSSNVLRISVTDEGCGIPDAELARVMEPFYTTKAPDQGTGLGLAMVDKFCQESGGYCAISSEVNIGTRVSMVLPIVN